MITIYLSVLENEDDKQIFHNMYNKYNSIVYRVSLKILNSQHDAEDAAHNMWLKVIRNFKKISVLQEHELLPYLIIAAKNCSLDIIAQKKKLSPTSDELLQFYAENRQTDPNNISESSVASCISSMPPIDRRVLDLKYIMGMKNREISEYLQMNQSTVESRLRRGKQMLKNEIIRQNKMDQKG